MGVCVCACVRVCVVCMYELCVCSHYLHTRCMLYMPLHIHYRVCLGGSTMCILLFPDPAPKLEEEGLVIFLNYCVLGTIILYKLNFSCTFRFHMYA